MLSLGMAAGSNVSAASNPTGQVLQGNMEPTQVSHSFPLTKFSLQDSLLIFSGKVVDPGSRSELPGVNVLLKGSKIGTKTDAAGRFYLAVPRDQLTSKNPVLIFSLVGYVPVGMELSAISKEQMTIEMSPDVDVLGEIHIPWFRRFWWWLSFPFRKG